MPGRLFFVECNKKQTFDRQVSNARSISLSRFLNKQGEVSASTKAANSIHWRVVSMLFQWDKALFLPTPDSVEQIKRAVLKINISQVTATDYIHLLGLMVSCIEMIPYAHQHMRPKQLYMLFWCRLTSRNRGAVNPCSSHLIQHLILWLPLANILKGKSLQPVSTTETISTEASKQGHGGMLGNLVIQEKWSFLGKEKHINWLELEAVNLMVKKCLP